MLKNNASKILLVLILFIGIFLRFYKLNTNFVFEGDQNDDMFALVRTATNLKTANFGQLSLRGEPATYFGPGASNTDYSVYSGVFYFYFLLIPAVFSSFSPFWVTAFIVFLNALTVFLVYLIGRKLFDEKTALTSSFLFAVFYWPNAFARAIWTPTMMPFFVSISFYLLLLLKEKKREWIWPFFTFFLGATTQIHDSGYFYLAFLLIAGFILKPEFPKKMYLKILSVFSFLLPIIPTLIYEFLTGFRMTKIVISQFFYHPITGGGGILMVLGSVFMRFWEFWASLINPWQFDTFFKDVYGISGVLALYFFGLLAFLSFLLRFLAFPGDKKSNLIMFIFILMLLPIPYLSKTYYMDINSGLIFGGGTFPLLGAIPIVSIWIGSFFAHFLDSTKIIKSLVLVSIIGIGILNILTIKFNIWDNHDQKFDFGTKLKMMEFIEKDVNGRKYDLNFVDLYDEGRGLFYIVYQIGAANPVLFNGQSNYSTFLVRYPRIVGKSEVTYTIAGQTRWINFDMNPKWRFLSQFGRFKVYRSV